MSKYTLVRARVVDSEGHGSDDGLVAEEVEAEVEEEEQDVDPLQLLGPPAEEEVQKSDHRTRRHRPEVHRTLLRGVL